MGGGNAATRPHALQQLSAAAPGRGPPARRSPQQPCNTHLNQQRGGEGPQGRKAEHREPRSAEGGWGGFGAGESVITRDG